MKIVFIAGPYYGGGDLRNIDKNIREAESFAIALANRGVGFFGPHLHTARFELRTMAPEEYYKASILKCLEKPQTQLWLSLDGSNQLGREPKLPGRKKMI